MIKLCRVSFTLTLVIWTPEIVDGVLWALKPVNVQNQPHNVALPKSCMNHVIKTMSTAENVRLPFQIYNLTAVQYTACMIQ